MTKYFIFDTETTSLKEPFIIQFAYVICDEDSNIIERYNEYWKTDEPISEISQDIHHITTEILDNKGKDPLIEIPIIDNKMRTCHKIIAHNIHFDLKAIYWTRKKLNLPVIHYENIFCTMRQSKYFVGLYNQKGWIKWPKLIELYRFLGKDCDEEKLHDAMEDVNVLKECYFLAKDRGFWK